MSNPTELKERGEGLPYHQTTSASPNNSISLTTTNENKQGIINVIFTLDPSELEWIANTWWDGKIETDAEGHSRMIPNVTYYRCPYIYTKKATKGTKTDTVCGNLKSMTDDPLYTECRGKPHHPHESTQTDPYNWHPLCSEKGMLYLLGQLKANINPNIQTANFGKSSQDVKVKADLEDKLINTATDMGKSIVISLLADQRNLAPWLLADPTYGKLPEVFSISFLTNQMTETSMNILASYTKGKNMEAVAKVLENRIRTEQEITNKSERSALEQNLNQSSNGGINSIFGIFGNKQR